MLRDMIITIMAVLLMALIMGRAIMGAITHVLAKLMTWLADKGTFTMSKFDYMEFYESHAGDLDIEH